MQFHYNKTLKQKIKAMTQIADETPAWLTICLAKSLKEWLGQSCRVSDQDGSAQLQLGYEALSVRFWSLQKPSLPWYVKSIPYGLFRCLEWQTIAN